MGENASSWLDYQLSPRSSKLVILGLTTTVKNTHGTKPLRYFRLNTSII
jgi:hypothetical protein